MTLSQRIAARRPVLMTVQRHEAVGAVMDAIALASDALISNGAALQLLDRARQQTPGNVLLQEATRATHDTHAHLMQLLADLRARAGALDGTRNGA